MPWFKVDDKLHDHRKSRAAGAAAMGVWVLAGSWSADNLTDGFIPESVLPRWGRQREASRLVEVGLWYADEQDGEKGWRFHEWDERQPTRAQKMAERENKAAAGRIGGVKSGKSRREAGTKQSASGQVEPPSRPVPDPTTDAYASVPLADGSEASEMPEGFEEWWIAYDRKGSKKPAMQRYRAALKKTGVTPDLLLATAQEYIAWKRSEGKHPQFTKNAETWLNQECWNDERPARQQPPTRTQQHLALARQLAEQEREATIHEIGGNHDAS